MILLTNEKFKPYLLKQGWTVYEDAEYPLEEGQLLMSKQDEEIPTPDTSGDASPSDSPS